MVQRSDQIKQKMQFTCMPVSVYMCVFVCAVANKSDMSRLPTMTATTAVITSFSTDVTGASHCSRQAKKNQQKKNTGTRSAWGWRGIDVMVVSSRADDAPAQLLLSYAAAALLCVIRHCCIQQCCEHKRASSVILLLFSHVMRACAVRLPKTLV